MLFKIKQQLFANVPNGAPQLYWGTFRRVCIGALFTSTVLGNFSLF